MPDKFKIGLITDSRRVSKYVRQFIEWAETQDHLYISNLIIQDIHRSQLANIHNGKFLLKKPGIIHSLQRASFALITKLESIVIQKSKKYKGHFKKFDVGPTFKKPLHIKPIVSESGLVYRFSQQDVEEIRNLNLDALVHVGSGLLRGDILQAATFGVICADASDVRFFRGGPPGFWEVFTKRDCTGFTIQQLTEERDRENILFRGQFSTRFFYVLNQAFLYIRSNYYLQKVLSDIARTRSLPLGYQAFISNCCTYSRLPKKSSTKKSISCFLFACANGLLHIPTAIGMNSLCGAAFGYPIPQVIFWPTPL